MITTPIWPIVRWFVKRSVSEVSSTHSGVYVDAPGLMALEKQVSRLLWPPQSFSPHRPFSGSYSSHHRGRGLDFVGLRRYQPGDDTRCIDWRATLRSRSPHVRMYTQELERSTWLVVDQRMSMFFARQGSLRSVVAAQAAAIYGWRALASGDRVGGLILGDDGIDKVAPSRGKPSFMRLIQCLTRRNHALRADSHVTPAPSKLNDAINDLLRYAPRDALIAVFSDFNGLSAEARLALMKLSRHNRLVLIPVWEDPAGLHSMRFHVSDGHWYLPINHTDPRVRNNLAQLAQQRKDELLGLSIALGCDFIPITTTQAPLDQLTRSQPRRNHRNTNFSA